MHSGAKLELGHTAETKFQLVDGFGRGFSYLRLSITDACNFRCLYCLPNGYQRNDANWLTVAEIRRLCVALAELGLWKVRLTGGEPTTRHDLLEVIQAVAGCPTVTKVAISTNGYKLKTLAPALAAAGVSAVNVSVDSLSRTRFTAMTGQDKLDDVLAGIEAAEDAGLDTKLNAVMCTGADELELFLAFIKPRPLSVRFIELMRTGENARLFAERHVPAKALIAELERRGFSPRQRGQADGPAIVYAHPDYAGSIGVIAPYGDGFCQSCNRLRVTSHGALRLCLFGDNSLSLRPWLRSDEQKAELQQQVVRGLGKKALSHALHAHQVGETPNLSVMGG